MSCFSLFILFIFNLFFPHLKLLFQVFELPIFLIYHTLCYFQRILKLVLLGRKLYFSLTFLLSNRFLFFILLISEKIIINSYENRTLEVRHDKLILFLQNTRCKLHIKCIIYSSPYVLLTFF